MKTDKDMEEHALFTSSKTNSSMIECRLERDSQHGSAKKMQNMPSQKKTKTQSWVKKTFQ